MEKGLAESGFDLAVLDKGVLGRWLKRFSQNAQRVCEALRTWRRRAHQRRMLARMSQRERWDIGCTNADVWRELKKPFWKA
jgi:uncharacterized protein YjiS (DUF1127 family)